MGNFIYSYKYLFSMTVLKCDDIIKKSRDLDYYFDIFWKISFSTTLMIMMMMNCFCGVVDRRKAFSLISSRGHCQRSSPLWISDTPQAGHIARALLVQGLWHFVPLCPSGYLMSKTSRLIKVKPILETWNAANNIIVFV